MVSTCRLEQITGTGLYGRFSVLRAGKNESPIISQEEGWLDMVMMWMGGGG